MSNGTENMGLTFGGDIGFGAEIKKQISNDTPKQQPDQAQDSSRNALNVGAAFTLDNEFKKDMLLSFYDWPNVESSTILSTQNTKLKIQ